MKKRIKLTEEGLIKIIRIIVEQVNLEDYDDSDFVDVFLLTFRQWLTEQIGEEIKKYPMSLLIKKFGWKFIKNYVHGGVEVPDWDDQHSEKDFDLSPWDFARYGREIVEKNKYNLPGLYKEEKFTEKYAKALNTIIESLDFPSYVSLKFTEDQPYRVNLTLIINFPEMIKDKEEWKFGRWEWREKLEHYIQNFLGVDLGNPSHGGLELRVVNTEHEGLEEWVKKVLNKSLKKEIRQLPGVADTVSRMGFDVDEKGGTLIVYFKNRSYWGGGLSRYEIINNIRNFLTEEGYGPNLKVKTA